MADFDLKALEAHERAFIESVEGLYQQIEALKIVFPQGPMRVALEAMQEANTRLASAALKHAD